MENHDDEGVSFYSFELRTAERSYVLYVGTGEERDLWVSGL